MTQPLHPTRIVRFNLMATLLGVALPFAIQDTVGASVARWCALFGFLLIALNFFHGKIVTLEDEEYNAAIFDRPGVALADYALNLAIVLTFVFMAFSLGNLDWLIWTNILLRVVDIALIALVMTFILRSTKDPDVQRAQLTWLYFDAFGLGLWISALILAPLGVIDLEFVGVAFLGLSTLELAVDYGRNHKLYFSTSESWGQVAELWDTVQGAWGDAYRRRIVVPRLLSDMAPLEGRRVLDLGCGNGSVARWLAHQGAEVTGVDKFDSMLARARAYRNPPVRYAKADLGDRPRMIDGGPFDRVVLCFTVQDVEDLSGPMGWAELNLASKGEVFVVFENEEELERAAHSTSRRRWLDRARSGKGRYWWRRLQRGRSRRGRRQLISWDPDLMMSRSGRGSSMPRVGMKTKTTLSRVWSHEEYAEAAEEAGLSILSALPIEPAAEEVLPPELPERAAASRDGGQRGAGRSPGLTHEELAAEEFVIGRYRANPWFYLMRLQHTLEPTPPPVQPALEPTPPRVQPALEPTPLPEQPAPEPVPAEQSDSPSVEEPGGDPQS